jgi:hypothetical protein
MQVINTLSYLIITHSRFEKEKGWLGGGLVIFFFARWFHFMSTLLGDRMVVGFTTISAISVYHN